MFAPKFPINICRYFGLSENVRTYLKKKISSIELVDYSIINCHLINKNSKL